MDDINILGLVIMIICCWGSAALFLGIGIHARKSTRPILFWAGSVIDPQAVTDISAYNRETGGMWMFYSVPYWIAGAIDLFFQGSDQGTIFAAVVLLLACLPGIPLLIRQYRRIAEKYIRKQ